IDAIVARPRPWLLGVDVDGTISPIVTRPDEAVLVPGAREALDVLAQRDDVTVAVVSGRPLSDLRGLFGLPDSVSLVGSHGAEDGAAADLSADEQNAIDAVLASMERVVEHLAKSWIEFKPVAVALHVRESDPLLGAQALADLGAMFDASLAHTVHRGHMVLEVAVREASKVIAFERLRKRIAPATSVFIGDDQSDDRVFASLGAQDVSVKVGPGPTAASYRLVSPLDVVDVLRALSSLESEPGRDVATS
ncbi:MAG: trehalose-phosphatase, partial [Ilumatobacteraceae bacterium]